MTIERHQITVYKNAIQVSAPIKDTYVAIPEATKSSVLFASATDSNCTTDAFEPFPDAASPANENVWSTLNGKNIEVYFADSKGILLGVEGEMAHIATEQGGVRSVAVSEITKAELPYGITLEHLAAAVYRKGSPVVFKNRSESEGTITYLMETDGFNLTYDIRLEQAERGVNATIYPMGRMYYPGCVKTTADVKFVSKELDLSAFKPVPEFRSRGMSERPVRAMAAMSLECAADIEVEEAVDICSIKGQEPVILFGNGMNRLSLGIHGKDIPARILQNVIYRPRWDYKGFKDSSVPNTTVEFTLPQTTEETAGIQLPQGVGQVSMNNQNLGTAAIPASYPGEKVSVKLLSDERIKTNVEINNVGDFYSFAYSDGKAITQRKVSSNATLTVKAPGIAEGSTSTVTVQLAIPQGATLCNDIEGAVIEDNQLVLTLAVDGQSDVTTDIQLEYLEGAQTYVLDTARGRTGFIYVVLQNKDAVSPETLEFVEQLESLTKALEEAERSVKEISAKLDETSQKRVSIMNTLSKAQEIKGMANGDTNGIAKSIAYDIQKLGQIMSDLDEYGVQLEPAQNEVAARQEALDEFIRATVDTTVDSTAEIQ